jgi:Mn-dependent DtxR family transcriptional regulator
MKHHVVSERDEEVLRELEGRNWARLLDVGGTSGSHHSNTLAKLARYGLVQYKQRGTVDPPNGQNDKLALNSGWGKRRSILYRLTPEGREYADALATKKAAPKDGL